MLLLRFQGGCKGNPAKSKGGAELRAQSRRGVQTYPRKEKGGCKVGGAKHRGVQRYPHKEEGWRKVGGAKAKRDYRDSYDYESQESFVI